ncbi:amidohydrolase [Halodesulfovibrio spirochaetisodalis]|uniref:Amidohydrolase n=1 Tax=Halodesulfovibrio spirochaetisodalis TaxID=1560234 RepID=A0A1B7XA41_9BACT|nr:amidohydrolase [Halodesulfovibrio spirochaetisodalis]OBQ46128.1 amidohydrolase [Halodesulfovibrio spirochaetisodalis]OBQ46259.1 amidohydrolase [Halodesulfovibrio spirochaetisodalis]
MSQKLLRNALILSMNDKREMFVNGDILITGDRISAVGTVEPELISPDAEVIDCTDSIIIPGLINTHVHLCQQLGRGLGDDVDLLTWLHERTWPYELAMTEEDVEISALACCAELIRSGVTCFAEPGGQHVDAMGRAVTKAGIRGILARSTMDCGEGIPENKQESTDEALNIQLDLIKRWNGAENDRIRCWFGLRTIFNNSDELIVRTKKLADEMNLGIHMHVAEIKEEVDFVRNTRGATTVEHLAKLGALGPNLLAVHTVWLTEREIELFAEHNVKVSHNPGAAMRVLGFAPVPEMLNKGVCVSIATDGAPCNNRMDMLDELYLTALIHKGRTLDSTTVPAETILEMATVNAAKALLWEDQIGSLTSGKKADLAIIKPSLKPGSVPVHDPVSSLVYSMHSSNVTHTMCDGQWLMKDKAIVTFDESALLEKAQQHADSIRERAGIQLKPRFPVVRVR